MPVLVVFMLLSSLIGPALSGPLGDAIISRFQSDDVAFNRSEALEIIASLTTNFGTFQQRGGPLQPVIDWAAKFATDPKGATSTQVAALDKVLANLPSTASLTAVRRILVAGVVLRHLQDEALDAVTELALQGIILRLYTQHRATAARKGVAEFTHLSKAGGTSLCHLSRMNSCKPPDNNCAHTPWGDVPRWTNRDHILSSLPRGASITSRIFWPYQPRTKEVSCAERHEYLLSNKRYFYAHEYTNMGGTEDPAKAHTCHEQMVTVLLIRDPEKRALSHMRHWWRFFNMDVEDIAERELFFPKGYDDLDTWRNIMTASLDNGLTRTLLGEALYYSPFGSVNRTHLDLARSLVLHQYDVLLVRDYVESYSTAIKLGLGWCMVHVHEMNQVYKNDQFRFDAEAVWAAVQDANVIDRELYSYTNALSQLDLVVYDVATAAGYGHQDRLTRELLVRGYNRMSHLGIENFDGPELLTESGGSRKGQLRGAGGRVKGEADLYREMNLCTCGVMQHG